MTPIFTYWDGDQDEIADHIAHWRAAFPDYVVVDPGQARSLLADHAPAALEMFDRIAIPACRSDIARLLALSRWGGLYVDAHCIIGDHAGVEAQAARLSDVEMVVSTRYAPNFGKVMPHNSIIWSRPDAPTTTRLLDTALANAMAKYAREQAVGFEPCHIWDITGPGVFWRELFDTNAADGRLRPRPDATVAAVFETANPITRHVFTGYRRPGSHWSERQAVEPLFR